MKQIFTLLKRPVVNDITPMGVLQFFGFMAVIIPVLACVALILILLTSGCEATFNNANYKVNPQVSTTKTLAPESAQDSYYVLNSHVTWDCYYADDWKAYTVTAIFVESGPTFTTHNITSGTYNKYNTLCTVSQRIRKGYYYDVEYRVITKCTYTSYTGIIKRQIIGE